MTSSGSKAVIKNADMSEEMQADSIDCATQALEKFNIEKDIAAFIKKEFDKKYNPTWHCIVGRNFGRSRLRSQLTAQHPLILRRTCPTGNALSSQLQNSGWEFASRVETDGVSISVHLVRSQAVKEAVELAVIGPTAAAAGTTLDSLKAHIHALKATWGPLWEEYLKPRWRRQRSGLHHAQERVIEGFYKKGGWKANAVREGFRKVVEQPSRPSAVDRPDRLVIVDEFRTSRVSSSAHGPQPCELHPPRDRPRPEDWVPPAGQVIQRLVRPAQSQQHGEYVRGLLWCHHGRHLIMSEFCKAATLLIVTVPGSVEEERPFSAMNFIKDERRNSLSANLPSTLRVYLDKTFTLKTDRDTNERLNLQGIRGSVQRPLEMCIYEGLEALPPIGKEYQQRYKLVIKVPEGAVLRGCKKTRRKLREHLRLRAEMELRPPQAPRSSQAATQAAASEPGPSTPQPAKRSKRTKAEPGAAEPTKGKGKGKAAKAKPAPQPGRWLDRDCNAALNMQRIGESRWRPLELCFWPDQGALPAKGKEYPEHGYKRLRDKPPKAQEQQPAEAQ
ncbi:hypothetical protein QJQ45_011703 [Haematococcus lacustris]|nr:hypothetical protein QJQ45_011703 [Haematococcus lacustris]